MNNQKIKVAINGFGRIGRAFFKMALASPNIEVVAVNDLGDIENMVYLLNYDTAQKTLVELEGQKAESETGSGEFENIILKSKKYKYLSVRKPADLPWAKLGIDVVVECTGVFNSFEKSNAHLEAGAKRVVLSGPTKDAQNTEFGDGKVGTTVLLGVNDEKIKTCAITSNGSCTTNASANVLDLLDKEFGVESAFLNTIHSYTASQAIVDGPVKPGKKDYRRGRAGAANIVPTSTGSAVAVTKVATDLAGKFDGMAVRVPTVSGSLVDITFISKRDLDVERVNAFFESVEKDEKYEGLIKTTKDQLVSSDIVGMEVPAVVDLNFTKVNGRLCKLLVWYDNEVGFTATLLKHVEKMGESLRD